MHTRSNRIPLLFHKICGQGKTPLVLIHGMDSSQETFSDLICRKELNEKFRILLIDLKGHGQSHCDPFDDYSMESHANEIERVIETLKEFSNFHLLGHSMGGLVVAKYYDMYPHRIKSLIIEDIDLSIDPVERNNEKLREQSNNLKKIPMKFDSLKEMRKAYEPYISGPKLDDYLERKTKFLEKERKYTWIFRPWVTPLSTIYCKIQDNIEIAKKAKVPILAIVAFPLSFAVSKVGFMEFQNLESLKRKPEFKLSKIENAGHSIHRTNEKEFIDELLCFVDKHN